MIKVIFDVDKSNNCVIQSNELDLIRSHFSVKDPIANIKKKKYGGYIPARLYAITPTGRFKFGMFYDIVNYIKNSGQEYKIITTEKFKLNYSTGYDVTDLKYLNLPLRDYQEETIRKCLKFGFGTNIVATAGGKTLIMATLIKNILHLSPTYKILIIVPGIQLVEQTYNDFIQYGLDCSISKWSGNNQFVDTQVVIAGSNILLSKSTDSNDYKNYDVLIVDEVHKVKKGSKTSKLVDSIKAKHCYGFTGTLPENKIDEWNIIGKFGPILIEKTSKELRDEKHITDAFVQIIKLDYAEPLVYKTQATFLDPSVQYNEECEYIYFNKFRNSIISKLANKVDNNILILVDRIDHGEVLRQQCTLFCNKEVYFIQGNVEVEDRENIRKLMEEKNNIVCIAMSAIFSTGINIKNLHYIMFAAGGKAKVRIIQAIGRGLRLHENKDMLTIIDIADHLMYSEKHLEKRILLYTKEKIKYAIKKIKEGAS